MTPELEWLIHTSENNFPHSSSVDSVVLCPPEEKCGDSGALNNLQELQILFPCNSEILRQAFISFWRFSSVANCSEGIVKWERGSWEVAVAYFSWPLKYEEERIHFRRRDHFRLVTTAQQGFSTWTPLLIGHWKVSPQKTQRVLVESLSCWNFKSSRWPRLEWSSTSREFLDWTEWTLPNAICTVHSATTYICKWDADGESQSPVRSQCSAPLFRNPCKFLSPPLLLHWQNVQQQLSISYSDSIRMPLCNVCIALALEFIHRLSSGDINM